MARLARWVLRHRVGVLAGTVGFLVVAGLLGGSVEKRLTTGGFDDPASQSSRVQAALAHEFPGAQPNLLLLVTARHGTVDAPAAAAAGRALTDRLDRWPGVTDVVSYWTTPGAAALRGSDGRQALIAATVTGDNDQVTRRSKAITAAFTRRTGDVTVAVGGYAAVFQQVSDTIQGDLARAEGIAVPITAVLLVLVFASAVAASLPVGVGLLAIVGTLLVLRLLSMVTGVSVYAINLATSMGLGLGIDYSLFIVSRYREELARGLATDDAVVAAMSTAGRTVVFSAATVAASLCALLVFPLVFLRSFAYAGAGVIVVAAAGATLTLPAVLSLLGPRVNRWSIGRLRRGELTPPDDGAWRRLAAGVMRRPFAVGVPIVVLLAVLATPFAHVVFGTPDDRVLPASASTRQVGDQLRHGFPAANVFPVVVLARGLDDPARHRPAIDAYARTLSRVSGVSEVDALTGSYADGRPVGAASAAALRYYAPHATWLSVRTDYEPVSLQSERVVRAIRALPAPFAVQLGGTTAALVDGKHALGARLPLAGLIIALISFVVLFRFTGSVVLPLKALVMNVLSLTATFGAMVWVFQQGHGARLLGFTPTGALDSTTPVLMFCVAFGLSMDYEVFLLSRIKEEYDRSGDNTAAVAAGLQRTGPLVTQAAALIAVVFLAVASSHITFIKLMGVGMAMAVVVDATVIRGLLVPAFMRVAGDLNWWAPAVLTRSRQRDRAGRGVLPAPAVIDLRAPAPAPDPARVFTTLSRRELYERARRLGIAGRSRMSKLELAAALAGAGAAGVLLVDGSGGDRLRRES